MANTPAELGMAGMRAFMTCFVTNRADQLMSIPASLCFSLLLSPCNSQVLEEQAGSHHLPS
jgi:hypothetical protein